MWLFCKSGFFSAVQNRNRPDLIHVRARFDQDLEKLCKKYNVEPKITKTPKGDYLYRMDFARADWRRIVAGEAEDIDYDNFKAAVHSSDTIRNRAYMHCWSAMHSAQS